MRLKFAVVALGMTLLAGGRLRAQAAVPVTGGPLRLSLAEAIALGLARNPDLGMSRAAAEASAAQTMNAKSNQYPDLTLSGNWVRSNTLPEFTTGAVTMMPTTPPTTGAVPVHIHYLPFPGFAMANTREGDIYGVKVESRYALYTGGRIQNGIKAAELNQRSSELLVTQRRNELVYDITQAYNGILVAKEMVRVTDDAYATAGGHYRQVKALYNEGMVSSQDLLRVETELARIQSQRVQAKNGLEMAKLGLKNLLSIDLDTPLEVEDSLSYTPEEIPVAEDLYAQALKNRPETRILDLREQMAETLLEIAKANAYPTVGLFANYSWDRGQEMPPNDTIWRDGYQAGAAMSVPLFDGRATEAQVAEAEATLRQLREGKRSLELGVRTQVSMAVLAMKAARERIEAERANVKAAEKSYATARERYAVGLSSNLDVMDAQTQLLSARAQYVAAMSDYQVARAQLEAAMGNPRGEGK